MKGWEKKKRNWTLLIKETSARKERKRQINKQQIVGEEKGSEDERNKREKTARELYSRRERTERERGAKAQGKVKKRCLAEAARKGKKERTRLLFLAFLQTLFASLFSILFSITFFSFLCLC